MRDVDIYQLLLAHGVELKNTEQTTQLITAIKAILAANSKSV